MICLLGFGALAKEISELFSQENWCFIDPFATESEWNGRKIFKSLDQVIGAKFFLPAIADPIKKINIAKEALSKGLLLPPAFVHQRAYVHESSKIGDGAVVYPNACVSHNVFIGNSVVVSFCCSVGHDDVIGDYTTLSPSVAISGKVQIGDGVFFGTNCCVHEKLKIGKNAYVGMGSIVAQDIPADTKAITNPRLMLLPR